MVSLDTFNSTLTIERVSALGVSKFLNVGPARTRDNCRVEEAPNPKHQAPEKSQASSSKICDSLAPLRPLGLGIWSFSGVWSLVLGAFILVEEARDCRSIKDVIYGKKCLILLFA